MNLEVPVSKNPDDGGITQARCQTQTPSAGAGADGIPSESGARLHLTNGLYHTLPSAAAMSQYEPLRHCSGGGPGPAPGARGAATLPNRRAVIRSVLKGSASSRDDWTDVEKKRGGGALRERVVGCGLDPHLHLSPGYYGNAACQMPAGKFAELPLP